MIWQKVNLDRVCFLLNQSLDVRIVLKDLCSTLVATDYEFMALRVEMA